jgi:hypothetical protein
LFVIRIAARVGFDDETPAVGGFRAAGGHSEGQQQQQQQREQGRESAAHDRLKR